MLRVEIDYANGGRLARQVDATLRTVEKATLSRV